MTAIVGKKQQEAVLELARIGLRLGSVTEREAKVPSGEVIEQSPLPGAEVPMGTVVNLVVSSGTAAEPEEELGYVPGQQ